MKPQNGRTRRRRRGGAPRPRPGDRAAAARPLRLTPGGTPASALASALASAGRGPFLTPSFVLCSTGNLLILLKKEKKKNDRETLPAGEPPPESLGNMAFPHRGTPWTLDLLFPVDPHIRSTCSGRGGPTACASPPFFETPHCRLSSGVPAKRFVSPASPSPGSTVLNLDRAKRAQNEETTCCVVTSPGPRVRAQAPRRRRHLPSAHSGPARERTSPDAPTLCQQCIVY